MEHQIQTPDQMSSQKILDADDLIDEIIAKKGPHKYTEGLSEDNWEEELEQIPLFMKKVPDVVDPVKSPALAALQDLKYAEGTAEERAKAYKEDGNELFRVKKYREAVVAYSEAIKQNCRDSELNAVLYSNRAASHYHLENYRSCTSDSNQARLYSPNHLKAILRGAEAYFKLGKLDMAMEWCNDGLKINPSHSRFRELKTKSIQEKKRVERDQRKKQSLLKNKVNEDEQLVKALQSRGIILQDTHGPDEEDFDRMKSLSLSDPYSSISHRVQLNSSNQLVWPVLLLYPEYGQSDLIQAFNETNMFSEQLSMVLADHPPWDKECSYSPSTVEIFFKDVATNRYIRVDISSTLSYVLTSGKCVVVGGIPSFIVLVKDSQFRKQFITQNIVVL